MSVDAQEHPDATTFDGSDDGDPGGPFSRWVDDAIANPKEMYRTMFVTAGILTFIPVYVEFCFSFPMTGTSAADWAPIVDGVISFRAQYQVRYDLMAAASPVALIPVAILVVVAREKIVSGPVMIIVSHCRWLADPVQRATGKQLQHPITSGAPKE